MKSIFSILLTGSMIAMLASCSPKPDGAVEAGDAQDVASATAGSVVYAVNTEASEVTWIGYKPTGKHNGTIGISSGSIAVDNGAIVAGSITFAVKTLKVLDLPADSEYNGKLTGHLMSADFFDAENNPEATFEVVSAVAFSAETALSDNEEFVTENTPAKLSEIVVANPTHIITGNLTMRGVTKSISIPAVVEITASGVSAEANFNINRTDWNLNYQDESAAVDKAKDKFIYNTVTVGFKVQASTSEEAL